MNHYITSVLGFPWALMGMTPWVRDHPPAVTALGGVILVGVPLLIALAVASGARTARRNRGHRAQQEHRAKGMEILGQLPPSLVDALSAQQGVLEARTELLTSLFDHWHDVLPYLRDALDENVVTHAREKIMSTWTPYRRVEFCARYRAPLAVVFNLSRWRELFATSRGYELSGVIPQVTGVGESHHGMYIIVRSAPDWTADEWTDVRDVLATGLDAPNVSVEIDGVSGAIISLNDILDRPAAVAEHRASPAVERVTSSATPPQGE